MESQSKLIGENGSYFLDNSATNSDFYQISVLEDTVFTVCKVSDTKGGSETDVLTTMNLSGKTVKAGAILTPSKEMFSSVSVSSGSCMCYKLGR